VDNDTSVWTGPAKLGLVSVSIAALAAAASASRSISRDSHTKQISVASCTMWYSRSTVSTAENPSASTIQFIRMGSQRE